MTRRTTFAQLFFDCNPPELRGAHWRKGPIEYVDPLWPKTTNTFVPFIKHFRYSCQSEFRFCWLPAARTPKLSHIDLELGSLKDFSDLIVL